MGRRRRQNQPTNASHEDARRFEALLQHGFLRFVAGTRKVGHRSLWPVFMGGDRAPAAMKMAGMGDGAKSGCRRQWPQRIFNDLRCIFESVAGERTTGDKKRSPIPPQDT